MHELLRFFASAHLPARLQAVSQPLGDLAAKLDDLLPASAEKSAGLRKLLEAKDCFVRAALDAPAFFDGTKLETSPVPLPTRKGPDPHRVQVVDLADHFDPMGPVS